MVVMKKKSITEQRNVQQKSRAKNITTFVQDLAVIPYKIKYWRHVNSGTLIRRIAKILRFVDLILAVNVRGRDSNTLVYT